MEKRKNIKAMVKKFNEAVAKAKAEGTSVEMGRIEPVKSSLVDYRFTFWGEEFKINPLLFGILGLGIGVVSRSFGIGGGFLLVPAMTTLGALPMYVAVPISLIGPVLFQYRRLHRLPDDRLLPGHVADDRHHYRRVCRRYAGQPGPKTVQ
jgi:hypothetical protein